MSPKPPLKTPGQIAVAPPPGAGKRRRRRSQAERSAATRTALLEAAIKCLYRYGYGATTTINVAEEAGVSRGAMLHQFPSKADLMAFVVEETFARDVRLYQKLLLGIDGPRERMAAYPAAAWEVMRQPSGVAVIEILQGSRSEAELAEKLSPILDRIDAAAHAQLSREFGRSPSRDMRQLVVGLARGLAVMTVLDPDDEGLRGVVPLFQALIQAGLETGVFDYPPDPVRPVPATAALARQKPAPAQSARPAAAGLADDK